MDEWRKRKRLSQTNVDLFPFKTNVCYLVILVAEHRLKFVLLVYLKRANTKENRKPLELLRETVIKYNIKMMGN
ncbi:CLUMA_CG020760, isoform A [Clunio marinus]|uniref:CLUMA_CG020760, isoform A n=1 Tax=Clunio marinus TaxID=568069 RepID=A0A1J1J8L8_9DIPT|nr:CLUMA_CG020760, isoform A [Clunio marinus]